jgi:hypothetical protein
LRLFPGMAFLNGRNCHELAVFGLLQRLRPNIIYLTDGGGRKRVSETQEGLKSIGLLNHATFLNYTEEAFYDSLLARDHTFYEEVTDRVFGLLDSMRPTQILCDAVEFYNPVHDLSLPIVQAALRSTDKASVFEVPLVYQKSTKGEEYELQRLPGSRREKQIEIQLTEEELDKKLKARDCIYTSLLDQMGTLLSELPPVHAGLEVVTPASFSLQEPGADRILRYEWRAEFLHNRGEIDSIITYSNHYLPVASALLYSSGLTPEST